MKKKLSILIPCYCVERYIKHCLDSIFAIKMPENEYEVLCFDDQSTDNTYKLLKEYAEVHNNMQIVRAKANIGPGGGRNNLFAIARGEYIWYVDGDDLIIPDVVEDFIVKVEKNRLDVLIFNYAEWNHNQKRIKPTYSMPDTGVESGLELADKIFAGGLVNNMGYPVRFLIRREYLAENMISFPENMKYGEDTVWMAKVVLYARRMMSTSAYGYIYWHHEDSTCGTLSRIYPGRTIYEKCILTSKQLLNCVRELQILYYENKDDLLLKYADQIEKNTNSHYLNYLPIMLCRSNYSERRIFYHLFRAYGNDADLNKHANLLTRVIMVPFIGEVVSELITLIYKMKH